MIIITSRRRFNVTMVAHDRVWNERENQINENHETDPAQFINCMHNFLFTEERNNNAQLSGRSLVWCLVTVNR